MTRLTASPELAARVRAAIDEAERRARRTAFAEGGPPATWTYDREHSRVTADHDGHPVGVAFRRRGVGPDGVPYEDRLLDVDGEFMEHNDPAAVLRRCAADRDIVEFCAEVIGQRDLSRYGEFGALKDDPEAMAVTLAVETLLNLARGYGIADSRESG